MGFSFGDHVGIAEGFLLGATVGLLVGLADGNAVGLDGLALGDTDNEGG